MSARMSIATIALLAVAACYGPDDLVADASLEVLLTGAEPGDRVKLTLDGDESVLHVEEQPAGPLSLFARLPPGEHEGELELLRADARYCTTFSVETRVDRVEQVSLDLRFLPRCDEVTTDAGPDGGPPPDGGDDEDGGDDDEDGGELEPDDDAGEPEPGDDAGEPDHGDHDDAGTPATVRRLERVEEEVHLLECSSDCERETRVDDELRVSVSGPDGFEGQIPASDFAALEQAALSDDADLLFSGAADDCLVTSPPTTERVYLRRTYVTSVGSNEQSVQQTVEITGCGGVAASLRARVAFLREVAEESADAGDSD